MDDHGAGAFVLRDRILAELHRRDLLDVADRLRHPIRSGVQRTAARRWARRHHEPTEHLARRLSPQVWAEADGFGDELESRHRDQHEALRRSIRLGGGGDHRLLYFLTRLLRPEVVVETGVAAGWSTAAILAALERNGVGHLWSSELVYDRPWMTVDYRRYVGMVVDPGLHARWTLLLDGDAANLPRIVAECGAIDLVHLDSDKSVEGRARALAVLGPSIRPTAPVVIDDISDNSHFRDHVRGGRVPFAVVGPAAEVGIVWAGLEPRPRA